MYYTDASDENIFLMRKQEIIQNCFKRTERKKKPKTL